uniref:Uncharacterized protein n=1 Tax=Rhizophora mucronata TaxID=61149 RepID=A0A2P2QQF1_RHIMU
MVLLILMDNITVTSSSSFSPFPKALAVTGTIQKQFIFVDF